MFLLPRRPHSKRECAIKGVTKPDTKICFEPPTCEKGSKQLPRSFLSVPECPAPLLGRDLLGKLGAAIYLNKEKVEVLIPKDKGINAMAILHQALKGQEPVPAEILDQVNLAV